MRSRLLLTAALVPLVLVSALLAPQLHGSVAGAKVPAPADIPVPIDVPPSSPVATPPPEPSVAEPAHAARSVAEPSAVTPQPAPEPPRVASARPVDIVICLDSSGSMDGLLDSTRARLWDVINGVAKEAPNAHLRVGLITYGSPSNSSALQGYVVKQMDLTEDLDALYGRLAQITTDGGDEYVGWAIQDAMKKMAWSREDGAVKLVFVAGNESASQGPVPFRSVVADAREKGFGIHAIFAGNHQEGQNEGWAELASAARGTYAAIDMDAGTVAIATPYDRQLIDLNQQLNATYVPYGAEGLAGQARQQAQDATSAGFGSLSTRASTKSSGLYRNENWDLVDAKDKMKLDVSTLPAEALPPEMVAMSAEERGAYVDAKAEERARINAEIQRVNSLREAYADKERQQQRSAGTTAFDDAVREIVAAEL